MWLRGELTHALDPIATRTQDVGHLSQRPPSLSTWQPFTPNTHTWQKNKWGMLCKAYPIPSHLSSFLMSHVTISHLIVSYPVFVLTCSELFTLLHCTGPCGVPRGDFTAAQQQTRLQPSHTVLQPNASIGTHTGSEHRTVVWNRWNSLR